MWQVGGAGRQRGRTAAAVAAHNGIVEVAAVFAHAPPAGTARAALAGAGPGDRGGDSTLQLPEKGLALTPAQEGRYQRLGREADSTGISVDPAYAPYLAPVQGPYRAAVGVRRPSAGIGHAADEAVAAGHIA